MIRPTNAAHRAAEVSTATTTHLPGRASLPVRPANIDARVYPIPPKKRLV